MRSRRNNLLADLAKAPWPVGLVIGVMLFLLIHYGIPAWMASRGGPLAQAFARGTNPGKRCQGQFEVHRTQSGTFAQCDQDVTTFWRS